MGLRIMAIPLPPKLNRLPLGLAEGAVGIALEERGACVSGIECGAGAD